MRFSVPLLIVAQFASGCATSILPLCSDVASNSYADGEEMSHVNAYVRQATQERDITILELSPFAAEFRGKVQDIEWLQTRYPHLVCAFDPKKERLDREVFITCVGNTPEWIRIVQSERPQDLMTTQTLYRETCAIKP